MSSTSSALDPSNRASSNPLTHFLRTFSSYDANVMLAALISLLLVILFVLLLHLYARRFLARARQRRRSTSVSVSVSVSHVLRANRFHHFHAFNFDPTFPTSPSNGLDSAAISSIPLFVYKSDESKLGLECVICLSSFEDNDVGRELPKCGHGFHVDCIDMWLQSHSNCPICRAPLATEGKVAIEGNPVEDNSGELPMMDVAIDEESGNDDEDEDEASSSSSSSSALSSSLGCSLKRMLSRNRSEQKVFTTSNATEVDV